MYENDREQAFEPVSHLSVPPYTFDTRIEKDRYPVLNS